jgi:ABC-type uncharacterized transport system substrate-binding protein
MRYRPTILLIICVLLGACAGRHAAPVTIIVSDRLAAYQRVADALGARLSQAPVYALEGDPQKAQGVAARLRGESGAVIAVGALAARSVVGLSDRPVVFCQDFHFDYRRAAPPPRYGVRANPPAGKHLHAWKMLDPHLSRIVLISGTGLGEFAREARAAARELGVQMEHLEVQSDRELLYVVKRLEPEVQGLWFAPDNRVLSTEVLREVLTHSVRAGKQTLVFNSQLLGLGALLSVEGDPNDIAERVLEQLAAARAASPPRMLALNRARVETNAEVAQQLGLTIPRALQGLYVF